MSEEAMHTATLVDQPDKTPRKISMHPKTQLSRSFSVDLEVWKLVPLCLADDGKLFIPRTWSGAFVGMYWGLIGPKSRNGSCQGFLSMARGGSEDC
jgi:hypothetical protein